MLSICQPTRPPYRYALRAALYRESGFVLWLNSADSGVAANRPLSGQTGRTAIRRIEKAGNGLTNVTLKSYESVSQFWPCEAQDYLKRPVATRAWPPVTG
jgi:hypothetical protein